MESFLTTLLDEEIGVVVTDDPAGKANENTFVILRTKSKSISEETVEDVIAKYANINKKRKSDYISNLRIDQETTYKVYLLPISNLYSTFFGNIFPDFNRAPSLPHANNSPTSTLSQRDS